MLNVNLVVAIPDSVVDDLDGDEEASNAFVDELNGFLGSVGAEANLIDWVRSDD